MVDGLSIGAMCPLGSQHAWCQVTFQMRNGLMCACDRFQSSSVASACSRWCELCDKPMKSTEGLLVQGMDFHRDAEALKSEVVPQHNFKLTASHLEARHYGEVACRDFRESVLAVMPHR